MSKILISDSTYSDMSCAVTSVLKTFPLDVSGKRVVIKPNALRPSPPEAAVTTHPSLVKALVDILVERGAHVLVGDNPGGAGRRRDNREVFEVSGLMDAAGSHYVNFSADPVTVNTPHPACPQVVISRPILDADILISLPKFKTHGLTGLTGAIKNSYGFVAGGQKGHIHLEAGTPYGFAEAAVDIFSIRPPDLVIVDAVVGMQGNGPNSRDLIYIGKLIASTDAVAVDRVMAHMMNLSPEWLRTLTRAHELGLGEMDLDEIEILGELTSLEGFRVPPRFQGDDPAVLHETRKGSGFVSHYPHVDADLCDGCLTCVEECPASALGPVEGVPVLDRDLCVMCFCCQELCPRVAITAREPSCS